MPIAYTLQSGARVIHATASGAIGLEDVRRHLEDQRRDGVLPLPELVDARDATAVFSAADTRTIVDELRRLATHAELGAAAIIVGNDVTFGMLRMLEMLIGDVCRIRPFRDRAAAERWLADLDAEP